MGAILRHDKKVFREADSILNETDVRHIVSDLLRCGDDLHAIDWDMDVKIQHFCGFFNYEGNQFVDSDLKGQTDHLITAIHKLEVFLEDKFYPSDQKGSKGSPMSELWIPSPKRWKFEWDDATWQEYYKLVPELQELTDFMLEDYKSYRASVRTVLFL